MSEKEGIYKLKLKWKGVYDLKALYSNLKEWLEVEDFKWSEKNYVEKIKPKGKQVEINWEGVRAKDDYYTHIIKLTFFGISVEPHEMEKDGKMVKVNKGELELHFEAYIIRNPKDKWREGSLIKFLYDRYVMYDIYEENKIKLYSDVTSLIDEAKLLLTMYRA